ncbi:calcium-binding protein [Neptunicoccus sediminis]|uniref:calcium-binding protein n=1 Tax=Neptunicoccus sediminis TaxID=1892596 RepID=UPI000845F48D|nr:calcium-binding protein [Neptunicoccus sediminis]
MHVTMLSGITTSFQRFMVEHIVDAVTSATVRWRFEPAGTASSISVGPTLGDQPTFRFFGTGLAIDGDSFSGEVNAVDMFFPSSPYKAVRIEGARFDIGAMRAAAEDVTAGYNTDAYRDFLEILMGPYGSTVTGTDGKDVLEASFGRDVLIGGKGKDAFILHENADGIGNDSINGGKGKDLVTGFELVDYSLTLNLLLSLVVLATAGDGGGETETETIDIKNIEGGFGTIRDDTFIGDDFVNVFHGSDGNDTFYSGGGNDRNYGGSGDDTIKSGSGNDRNEGGAMDDFIESGAGNDRNFGGNGNDFLYGGKGDDTQFGGRGGDTLDGGGGDDTLFGGSGKDAIDGGAGADSIGGDQGNDRINGGGGDDAIEGGAGKDRLEGGAGDDIIDGGSGQDTITGGSGDDRLTGGKGADTFEFFAVGKKSQGTDTVTDFDVDADMIRLNGVPETAIEFVEEDGNLILAHPRGIIILEGLDLSDTPELNIEY